MDKNEVKNIIGAIMASYPNYKPADMAFTVATWTSMLADYDYPTISKALQKFIMTDTSGFAPSIGQVLGMIDMPVNREPLEAWDLVRKAIRNGYYFAEQEYSKLPIECQKAIGSPANLKEMALMPTDTVESVEQSHFIRSYQAVLKRMDEERRLPNQFRNYTNQIEAKMQEHKAIEVKEEVKEEEVKFDPNRESLTEMVRKRMEQKKRERKTGSQDKWRDIHTTIENNS